MAKRNTTRRNKTNPRVLVKPIRKDGKYPVSFVYDNGVRREKLITPEKLAEIRADSSYSVYGSTGNPLTGDDIVGLIPGMGVLHMGAKVMPKQSVVNRLVRGKRNPTIDGQTAFEAGKRWAMYGAHESGVANARVVSYGFSKWHNGLSLRDVTAGISELRKGWNEGYRAGKRIESKRNPAEDIEFLNDLAPAVSRGHIEFTQDGLERYVRDGYVYAAYSATPVQEDGYRVGTVEGVADESLRAPGGVLGWDEYPEYANPRRGRRNPVHVAADGLLACDDCAIAIANDDYSGMDDIQAQLTRAGLHNIYARGLYPVVGEELGFSHSGCSICKSFFGGNKHSVSLLSENPRRNRRNPSGDASAMYESFHGAPPSETLEITQTEHVHSHLAALGDLVLIDVKLSGGKNKGASATINAPDPARSTDEQIVRVCSNESGTQLYLVGGDQALDLKQLGFREQFDVKHDGETFDATEYKDLMVIGEITKLTYRTAKSFDNFEEVDYFHKLGEDTRVRPTLLYDTMNDCMKIAGGEYHIHDVGIVN